MHRRRKWRSYSRTSPEHLSRFAQAVLLVSIVAGAVVAAQGAPKVAPRDQLVVTVFGVEDLSDKFLVGNDGTITYPHLGAVSVAGLTTRDVEAELGRKLKEAGYVLNPQVTVELVQTQNKKVVITGAVRNPGPLPYAGQLTLFEALALAGSTTPDAGDTVLVVRSAANGASAAIDGESATGRGVIEVSLSALESGNLADHNLTLQDGDQIMVPRAQQVFISGQVRNPSGYTIPPGTTVLQAITLAGGLTDRGTMRGIKIIREKKEVKNVKADTLVKPGDTIIVKASPF